MKKTIDIVFDNEISCETTELFSELFNEAIIRNRNVNLHFSTAGGVLNSEKTMVRIVNNFPNDIKVFCDGWLFSAGASFLADLKKDIPVVLGDEVLMLLHSPSILLESRNTKKQSGLERFYHDYDEIMTDTYLKPFLPILTEEEIKLVKEGEDVVVTKDRVAKWLEIYRA